MTSTPSETSAIRVGLEHTRFLRGVLAIVLGVMLVGFGVAGYNIFGAFDMSATAVFVSGLLYYIGIVVAIAGPAWLWIGRPLYYIRQQR